MKPMLKNLMAFLALNWEAAVLSGKPLAVEIGPEKRKRSVQANRYYWDLLNQISEQAWVEGRQYASEVWHECAKRRFLGLVDLPGGGHMAQSTTDLSVPEFAEYVQKVEVWAASELGVTLTEWNEPMGRTA